MRVPRFVGGLEQEAMAVGIGFFAVGPDDVLRIVIARVLSALSNDASIPERL